MSDESEDEDEKRGRRGRMMVDDAGDLVVEFWGEDGVRESGVLESVILP